MRSTRNPADIVPTCGRPDRKLGESGLSIIEAERISLFVSKPTRSAYGYASGRCVKVGSNADRFVPALPSIERVSLLVGTAARLLSGDDRKFLRTAVRTVLPVDRTDVTDRDAEQCDAALPTADIVGHAIASPARRVGQRVDDDGPVCVESDLTALVLEQQRAICR